MEDVITVKRLSDFIVGAAERGLTTHEEVVLLGSRIAETATQAEVNAILVEFLDVLAFRYNAPSN